MASINLKNEKRTHEGGKAYHISSELELRRTVMSCLLWEKNAYEDGVSIADRIKSLIPKIEPEKVYAIAVEARTQMKLRHVPLLLAREMARLPKHKPLVGKLLPEIIQRPDELTEFLAIYWAEGKTPISNQVKVGLARAFTKFNEYSLQKFNKDGKVKLRDVLFLTHPKPLSQEQQEVWDKLAENKLSIPDTWEVALSKGDDKKATWERLIESNKLGALALLRNLRNMREANVDQGIIRTALKNIKTERVLPFRFLSAAKHAPEMEPELEIGMLKSLASQEKLPGVTALLVDVSGSMEYSKVSGKSDLTYLDAACAVAILLREICEVAMVYTFSDRVVAIPPRKGFALKDAVKSSQIHGGTELGGAVNALNMQVKFDRLIVITDEQSRDSIPAPRGQGFMVNVASHQNGVGYGPWVHVDGWSEGVVAFIQEVVRNGSLEC